MAIHRRDFLKQFGAVGAALGGGAYLAGLGENLGASADRLPGSTPLRPPGALSDKDFLATCIRCMRCVDACPNHCLVPVPFRAAGFSQRETPRGLKPAAQGAGTPTLKPRKAACMLCAFEDGEYLKCTEVCPSGALQLVAKTRKDILEKVRIGEAVIDFDLCYSYNNWSCGACYRACPLAGEAMTIGAWEQPTVHPEACVGCGCCERACIRYPHAIRVKTKEA